MRKGLLILGLALFAAPAYAQRIQGNGSPAEAIPVRCVNVAGTLFESCGGGGGAGTDVNISGLNGTAPSITNPFPVRLSDGAGFISPATEATLTGVLTTAAFQARINTLGQKVMASSTPVTIASDQAAFPVTANAGTNLNTSLLALEAGGNLAGVRTAVEIIDDWDEVDRAKVNPIAGQVGVQGNTGVVTALTQRTVLATDVGLPAGTANIGDVDIASIVCNTGATGLCKAEDVAVGAADALVATASQRQNPLTVDSSANNDYQNDKSDDYGRQYVNLGEAPTYTAFRSIGAGAAVDYLSIFNASGSGRVLRVLSIKLAWLHTAAITPIAVFIQASRTNTVGTTCTAVTPMLMDTGNAALPAQVTSNGSCTTDPVVSADWLAFSLIGEEGSGANPLTVETYDFIPSAWNQPLTLREGFGLMLKNIATLASTGTLGVTITFSCTTN